MLWLIRRLRLSRWKLEVNSEMADKLGHYKREVSTLNKKLEAVAENKKLLEQTCIHQQN